MRRMELGSGGPHPSAVRTVHADYFCRCRRVNENKVASIAYNGYLAKFGRKATLNETLCAWR